MELFGWIGTILFIICYLPQIYVTKRDRSIGSVSIGMWLIQWSAYTCCLIYAITIMSQPLMFGYAMGWLLTAWWLELARQYRKPKINIEETPTTTYILYHFPHRKPHGRHTC